MFVLSASSEQIEVRGSKFLCLKKGEAGSSETLVCLYKTALFQIQEDGNLLSSKYSNFTPHLVCAVCMSVVQAIHVSF